MIRSLTALHLHQKTRILDCVFDDGQSFHFPCEYLRVYSPSAEVRGHGLPEPHLVLNKAEVNIIAIEPVGAYAVKLVFDDGHQTGLYSFDFLYDLGIHQTRYWARYLERVQAEEAKDR